MRFSGGEQQYYGSITVTLYYLHLFRITLPGISHHVTQRGNRRQRIFMEDDDYALYRYWLTQACRSNGVEVWSYCLLPNHVHSEELGSGLGFPHF